MLISDIQIEQMQSRREREMVERVNARQHRLESPSIRRAIGRSIMSIGARLAAEPHAPHSRRLARSR